MTITRFAPSPTGMLHIGGARTALFSYLWAKRNGGTFFLRIEDTDKERSSEDMIQPILEGLNWLGIHWDDDPVYQSNNFYEHTAAVNILLETGHAYPCYCSKEQLDAMRALADSEKRPPKYDGTWRDRPVEDRPANTPFVIRFRAPTEGKIIVDDVVQGRIEFDAKDMDDFIILRADGTPTFLISNVVDDHIMGVDTVVRGDDHLTNAARQTMLFNALGWNVPTYAHIPLIYGEDGKKLSKRNNAPGIGEFRDRGYLPEAVLNYISRLGWAHGDDEIYSLDQMIQWFQLSDINKAPARLDFKKLDSINGHYIRSAIPEDLYDRAKEFANTLNQTMDINGLIQYKDKVLLLMPEVATRAKSLPELVEMLRVLWMVRPINMTDAADKLRPDPSLVAMLEHTPWELKMLEHTVHDYAEMVGLKLPQLAQPIRAALCGSTVSFGIYHMMMALGREESLERLRDRV